MGGDEFATMLLTDDDEEGAGLQKTMDKLIEEYNDSSEKSYRLSVSFVTLLFPYTKDANVLELLENADKQMYQIKKSHRAGRRRGDFPANEGKKTE